MKKKYLWLCDMFNEVFYVGSWLILMLMVALTLVRLLIPYKIDFHTICELREETGILCLGCGGTTAANYFITCQFSKSLQENFIVVGVTAGAIFLILLPRLNKWLGCANNQYDVRCYTCNLILSIWLLQNVEHNVPNSNLFVITWLVAALLICAIMSALVWNNSLPQIYSVSVSTVALLMELALLADMAAHNNSAGRLVTAIAIVVNVYYNVKVVIHWCALENMKE